MSPSAQQESRLEPSVNPLLSSLHTLHADEYTDLAKKASLFVKKSDQSWVIRSLELIKHYVEYIYVTWMKVVWNILFFPTTIMDRIALVALSSLLCVVMTLLLPWCILANFPIMVHLFEHLSQKFFNGMGLVNCSYPTMFTELTPEQVDAARTILSQDIKDSPSTPHKRIFNLDVAKLLLQCASLMYERTSHTTLHAASVTSEHAATHHHHHRLDNANGDANNDSLTSPDQDDDADQDASTPTTGTGADPSPRILSLLGPAGLQSLIASLHTTNSSENTIVSLARSRLGLEFSTVSELNSAGAAFCGLFWDKTGEHNFVIVSFKGTNPVDYMEWTTDFSCGMRSAGRWLSDFGRVHEGFVEKIFPGKVTPGSRMPFDTINAAIRLVAKDLHAKGHQTVNVWVTGHSLGCALASLHYARMIFEPHELGPGVVVRDAYLFAAPVCCDAESAAAFNNKITHDYPDHPRTMWRVTNGADAVASALPEAGDNSNWTVSPYNMFAFAHLGTEIKLRPYPQPCLVRGNHITPGTHVLIHSSLASSKGSRTSNSKSGRVGVPVIATGVDGMVSGDGLKTSSSNGTASRHVNGTNTNSNGTTPSQSTTANTTPSLEIRLQSERYQIMQRMQNVWGIGRLIAHGTGFYWNGLSVVGVGRCEWVEGDE